MLILGDSVVPIATLLPTEKSDQSLPAFLLSRGTVAEAFATLANAETAPPILLSLGFLGLYFTGGETEASRGL